MARQSQTIIPNSDLVFHFLPHNITPRSVELYRPHNYSSSSPIIRFSMVQLIKWDLKKCCFEWRPLRLPKLAALCWKGFRHINTLCPNSGSKNQRSAFLVMYTRVKKNPSAWNFLSPKPEVKCGTVYNRPTGFSRVTIFISGIYGCVVWLEGYPLVWLWGYKCISFINMPLINQRVLHPFIFTHPANTQYFSLFLWICVHDRSTCCCPLDCLWLCNPPVITRLRPS